MHYRYRISIVTKIVRIGKICLITILGIVPLNQIYRALFLMVFQIVAAVLFWIKFTYERIGDEYILLLGMVAGVVSCVEFIIGGVFGVSYLFIGEIFLVMAYLIPLNTIRALIELKYLFLI